MELNAKCPFVWDWDSLVMLPSRAVEVPKKFEVVDSVFEAIDGFEPGSLNSSGGRSDGVSGGSASDLVYGSSSKSSKSASVDSSSNRETRESKFTLETGKNFSQNPGSVKQPANAWPSSHRTSPTADISIGSGELLIGLKLGKRTYFEDASASANSRTSVTVSGTFDATVKRSKLSNIAIPRCQVEGCNLDLSSAKSYHRKHRVCENHSKSPKVVVCGLERRFCQQCSRFHSLSEFDQKKRSCRRRLCDHNARRRKPKPEIIRFNSMTLPPSLHGRANQMNLAFNQVTMEHTRPNVSSTWDFTSNSKYTQQDKLSLFSPVKTGDVRELHESCNEPEDTGFKLSYDSSQLLSSSKVASTQVFHQGLQMPTTLTSNSTTNMEATQDDLRALSLLSTNSWGVSSCDQVHPPPPPPSLQHHFDTYGSSTATTTSTVPSQSPSSNPSFAAAPQLHAAASASVLSTHCWQVDRQQESSGIQKVEVNSHFQEHQLFKASNEPGFYLY